ncbi:putative peptide chain release factor [Rosa chinensis]|uniref:Putative peptide chain release factor n=1 Tax=Rosa chinensis TaxID=74649 RepID=A0A2P6PN37_ROSCH|nr:putative peptide chain release factor [Rosa chinensis]
MSGLTTTSAPPRLLAIPTRHRFTDNSWTSIAIPKPHLRAPRIICMAAPYLITKLESAEKTQKELSVKLADPDVVSNPSEYQRLAQSVAVSMRYCRVVSIYKEYKDCEKQLEESKALVDEDGNDEEMAAMISYEIESLSNQMKELEEKLKAISI